MTEVKIQRDVDRIVELSATIAELNAEKKLLTSKLKSIGEGKYYGSKHYLTVALSERATLDMKAVRAKLSRQFISAHSRRTEALSVTLRGYNDDAKEA